MNESNALLAQKFRKNDQSAFARLVGRHHSLVFQVCLRILGHRQDAEDATQETFSRVARYSGLLIPLLSPAATESSKV